MQELFTGLLQGINNMSIYFSKSTLGFYNSEVNKSIPEDCVEIANEIYLALLEGQSGGKAIVSDENGYPILSDDHPQPTPTADDNKNKAMKLLSDTDWTQLPDVNLLNKDDFAVYREALRQIAINPPSGFIDFPVKPNEVWGQIEQ